MNKGLTASAPVHLPQWHFKHRDNLNTPLPVDDWLEGQVADAGFNR